MLNALQVQMKRARLVGRVARTALPHAASAGSRRIPIEAALHAGTTTSSFAQRFLHLGERALVDERVDQAGSRRTACSRRQGI